MDEEETQKNGLVLIIDLGGLSMRLFKFLSPKATIISALKEEVTLGCKLPNCYRVSHSVSDWLTESLPPSLTHSLPHSGTDWLTHSLRHWLTDSLTHSLPHSRTEWMTDWLTHSLTHSRTDWLTHSSTHSTHYVTEHKALQVIWTVIQQQMTNIFLMHTDHIVHSEPHIPSLLLIPSLQSQ